MIYSKSSADYAAKYDLKRCFRSGFLFPLLACGLFTLSLMSDFNGEDYVYRIFGSDTYETFVIHQYTYALFGALTGLFSFRFLTSVKMSNVYLSMGINRKQLVKNRILSSTVYFAIASVIPFIAAIIINKVCFTVEAGLIKACAFYTLVYFGDMLLGFAVASVFTVSVGNFIESGVCAATALLTPTLVIYPAGTVIRNFVNGAALSDYGVFYDFEGFCRTFASYTRRLNPLEYLDSTPPVGYKYIDGTNYELGGFDYLTVFVWLLIAVVILSFVPKLMEKRKAEIAGAVGANKKAVRFVCAVFAMVSYMLLSEFSSVNKVLCYVVIVAVPVMIYLGVTAAVYRNKAEFVASLKDGAVVAAATIVITVTLTTGIFGYFSKVPDPEEIEYAGICPASVEFIIGNNSSTRTTRNSSKVYGPMTDEDDIATIVSIHQQVTDGLGEGDDSVCFVYKLKDGRYVTRFYKNVSVDGARASHNVVNTKWYDEFIMQCFTDWDFDYEKEAEKVPEVTPGTTQIEETEIGMQCDYLGYKERFNSDEIYIYGKTLNECVKLCEVVDEEEYKEFRKIFAEELVALTPEEIFYPEEQALYYLGERRGDEEGYSGPSMQNIPIYGSMKKTVEFLNRHNISFNNLTSDDVVEMRFITPEPMVNSMGIRSEKSTAPSYISAEFIKEAYGSRESYYTDSSYFFLEYEVVSDKKLIGKYFDSYMSYCSFSGDNGKFVQFIFKDGSDLMAYIPEKEL